MILCATRLTGRAGFANPKKLRAVPFLRSLVALFKVFTHKLFDFKGVREGFAVQLLQLKEKKGNIFSQRKTEKKKAVFQVEGCKDARAARYEPFIYPCSFVRLELIFAFLFIGFVPGTKFQLVIYSSFSFWSTAGYCYRWVGESRKNSLEQASGKRLQIVRNERFADAVRASRLRVRPRPWTGRRRGTRRRKAAWWLAGFLLWMVDCKNHDRRRQRSCRDD